MSKLEELIAELCQDGVENIELSKVCRFQNGFAFKSNKFSDSGFPVVRITNINDGKLSDEGYVYFNKNDYKENLDQYKVKKGNIVVAMSGATTGKIGYNYSDNTYYLNQRVGMFIPNSEILINRYLYHWLLGQSTNILNVSSGTGAQPNLSSVQMMKFIIPIPPLPVQSEIVRILDNFKEFKAELTEELTAEFTARKKQYEYYHRKMLSLSSDVPRMKLGDICDLSSGGDVPKGHWSKEKTDNFMIPIYSNGIDNDGLYGYTDTPRITQPSVTIAGRGAGVGNAIVRKQPYFPIIRLVSAVPKEMVYVDYLYHCIKLIEFKIPQGGIPQLTVPMVSSYEIPVPELEVQKKIATKLNSLEKIISDMRMGIPAEINARNKQYEYYRDKLLTFDDIGATI